MQTMTIDERQLLRLSGWRQAGNGTQVWSRHIAAAGTVKVQCLRRDVGNGLATAWIRRVLQRVG